MAKITIISAATNEKYLRYLGPSLERIRAFGYGEHIFDLSKLGFGHKYNIREQGIHATGPTPWYPWVRAQKIEWILEALKHIDGFAVWVDADAIVVRPFDEAATDDYDIGVMTERRMVSAAVMFINNNERSISFLERWNEKIRLPERLPTKGYGLTDMKTLNNILGSYRLSGKPHPVGDIYEHDGARIKIFDGNIYNHIPSRYEIPENVKVVHLSGKNKGIRWLNGLKAAVEEIPF